MEPHTQKMKPILFSTPMVQAILEDRKTMTRRIMNDQPNEKLFPCGTGCQYWANDPNDLKAKYYKAKYEIGDILWVRETWRKNNGMPTGYPFEYRATAEADGVPIDEPWKPSIFMPREAARIFLKVTRVRVERLQDISGEDAMKEGVKVESMFPLCIGDSYRAFSILWESINGKESWDANPWVWVYEFERVEL